MRSYPMGSYPWDTTSITSVGEVVKREPKRCIKAGFLPPWKDDPYPKTTTIRHFHQDVKMNYLSLLAVNVEKASIRSAKSRAQFQDSHMKRGRIFHGTGLRVPPEVQSAIYRGIPDWFDSNTRTTANWRFDEPLPWTDVEPDWRQYYPCRDPFGRRLYTESLRGTFKGLCMEEDDLCDKDNDLDIRYTKDHLNQSRVTRPQAYGERSVVLVKAANCVFYMNRLLPCHLCERNTHTRYLLPLLCGHYWCRGCVEFGMLQSIHITSEDFLPGCCGLDIPPPLGQRLPSQELARAYEHRFLQFKNPQAEWQRCPDPSCNAYIQPKRTVRATGQVDCDICRTRVCPRCRKRC